MTKLLAIERETIILFNEAEPTAEIEAHNCVMKRRLENMRRGHPETVTLIRRDKYADVYTLPKKWVKIIPPRRATEKQREHLAKARNKIKP